MTPPPKKTYSSKPINPDWYLPVTPYPFQWEVYRESVNYIKNISDPGFIYCSVSAGKSLMMAMISKHVQQKAEESGKKQLRILCMARTGELVEQNSEQMWDIGCRNSIFSQSVGIKSTKYPVVVGSEGSVCRALDKQFKDVVFDIILWDECHTVPTDDPESQAMKIINNFHAKNPKLRVIGYTGSPFRGVEAIKGKYWKNEIYRMDMWGLVELGFVCTPIFGFGHDDVRYNLDDIKPSGIDGTDDFDKAQLNEMQKRILADGTTTQKIMLEVMDLTKNRNCVLITCAGSKHIAECVKVLPEGTYATITEKTKYKERKLIKEGCNNGTIKYVLQIGCWTTGVNIPPIDTIVILRKIGSLTLLTQLIGRGIRKLKQFHIDLGMTKDNCAVMDYSETMESLGELFNDPILESAQLEKAKKDHDTIECGRERCRAVNSAHARRCLGKDLSPKPIGKLAPDPRGKVLRDKLLYIVEPDGRCGMFWGSPKICPKCTTPNDKVARSCRRCDHMLIDPNANLTNKHYTDDDWQTVVSGRIILSKDKQKIIAQYQLESGVVAKEIHNPSAKESWMRAKWVAFFNEHMPRAYAVARGINNYTSAAALGGHLPMFNIPCKITHRVNEKGFDIIHRKQFLSGREVKA